MKGIGWKGRKRKVKRIKRKEDGEVELDREKETHERSKEKREDEIMKERKRLHRARKE